jgi:hypothetical protein
MNNLFEYTLHFIGDKIKNMGYTININTNDNIFEFLIQKEYDTAGYVQMVISNEEINTAKQNTRASASVEHPEIPVIHILYLFVNQHFRGQKLAILLMLYGLCYLKKIYPYIKYASLDDDSDKSLANDASNIYNRLGFQFKGPISQDMYSKTQLNISGPEKILDLNFFENRILPNLLQEIQKKGGKKLTKKFTKTRRFKKTKHSRRVKKNYFFPLFW